MKKIYISLLLALSLFLFLNITQFQAEAKDSDFEIVNGVLNKYNGSDKTVTVPDGVTEIGDYAFSNSTALKVILPSTLKRLGDDAFYHCSILEEITLPSSLESFGKQSFEFCYKLNKLNLFDTNDEMNFLYVDGVLYNKDKTVIYLSFERNDIVIPDTITDIGSYAFPFVTGTVVVPSSVTTFGENIFVKDKDDDTWSGNRIIVYGYLNSPIEKYCKENPYAIKFLAFDDTYTIHYNLYDAVNSPQNPTTYTRNTATIKLANPTWAGYVFKNWFTFYAPDIYGNFTKTYADESGSSKITQITKGSVGDIILDARWEKVTTGQAKITSAKKTASTKITVNLQSLSGAKGYQIIYANNSTFTSGKKTVNTQSLKYGLTNLKKGKTYYIKVRAYKLDSCGNKVYGKYSKVSKVKL